MEIKKALFFKPGAIGDFLHTLPALQSLRKKFPAARITVVVSPGLEPLISGTSVADHVLVYDKSKLKKNLKDFVEFGLRLRNERYDLFVDLQPSVRSFVLRWLSGAKRVLVYRKQKKREVRSKRLHAVENFMETLRPLGIDDAVERIELPVQADSLRTVGGFLTEHGITGSKPIIALNCSVGAARPARNWPAERFSVLADRIIAELGSDVVFIGGPEDRELVRRVLADMRGKAISTAGAFSIGQSAALLSRCACLVSSDTGPLHLATAVGTPVIGLFGSTDPRRTGPVGRRHQVIMKDLPCVPCEEKTCPLHTNLCMTAITVDDVVDVLRKALGCN